MQQSHLEKNVKSKLAEIDSLLDETNKNILSGENSYFKFHDENKKKGKWHLTYEGVEDKDINNPIFKKIPKIDLADLVFFVNKKTKFFSAFTHICQYALKIDPLCAYKIDPPTAKYPVLFLTSFYIDGLHI